MSTSSMIHILLPLKEGPGGGGYQFLKALRDALRKRGRYEDRSAKAGVFLFNSYQHIPAIWAMRRERSDAVFVHRVDGPMRLYNRQDDYRDIIVVRANSKLADGTVFQSVWSREANASLGFAVAGFAAVIHNAPDPCIFFPARREGRAGRRFRVMATSWSKNPNKGFRFLEWLDRHLDFDRYEVTFMGNSPVAFSRIRHLDAGPPEAVAEQLRRHDVFLAASAKEACSNSILEALSCGLPVLALDDGSHRELIGEAGEYFCTPEEIPSMLARIEQGYEAYRSRITVRPLDDIAADYLAFVDRIVAARATGTYCPRRLTMADIAWLRWTHASWRLRERLRTLFPRRDASIPVREPVPDAGVVGDAGKENHRGVE